MLCSGGHREIGGGSTRPGTVASTAVRAIPEVVPPFLQLERVLGTAVRAFRVQVAIPVDVDAHSTTLHTTHPVPLVYGPENLPLSCRTLSQMTYQQCQVLKVPSSHGHKVPDAEHWAVRTGEWVIETMLEVGVVPGI